MGDSFIIKIVLPLVCLHIGALSKIKFFPRKIFLTSISKHIIQLTNSSDIYIFFYLRLTISLRSHKNNYKGIIKILNNKANIGKTIYHKNKKVFFFFSLSSEAFLSVCWLFPKSFYLIIFTYFLFFFIFIFF